MLRNQIFGSAYAVVCIPMYVVSVVLLHVFRDTHAVAKRGYVFLQVQAVCVLIMGILDAANMLAHTHCAWSVWNTFLGFALGALPIYMRCFIYCMRYNLTLERRKIQPQLHRVRFLKIEFLLRAWMIVLGIMLIPPLLITVIAVSQGRVLIGVSDPSLCKWPQQSALYIPFIILSFVAFLIAMVVSIVYLRRAKDVYHIRTELLISCCVWFVVGIVLNFMEQPIGGVDLALYVPEVFIEGLGTFMMNLNTSIRVILLGWKERRMIGPTALDAVTLVEKLRDPQFRAIFSDFLVLQLSFENLLFWEAIQEFKAVSYTPQEGKSKTCIAQDIYDNFIKSGSANEINLSWATRSEIEKRLSSASEEDSHLDGVFDAAEQDIVHLLSFHSYPLFCQHRRGASTAISIVSGIRKSDMTSSSAGSSYDI